MCRYSGCLRPNLSFDSNRVESYVSDAKHWTPLFLGPLSLRAIASRLARGLSRTPDRYVWSRRAASLFKKQLPSCVSLAIHNMLERLGKGEGGQSCSLGVGLDGGLYLQSKVQGLPALDGGDEWLGVVENAGEERFDLETERFAWDDLRLVEVESGGEMRSGPALYVDDEQVLPRVIDGHVLVGLEEAQLADAFGRDATGGEVGDTAGFELDACVGDVDLGGEDGQANGVDLEDGRVYQMEDDVKVVNHKIEDDVDVESTRAEDAEAMSLKEHGLVDT